MRPAKKVLLVGQPNVGKSSMLNVLTGAHVDVSNYPGTTVEIGKARGTFNGIEYEFIDTPGIYNLYPSSLEEEVTERALLELDYDFVVVVIDATAVERGLVFLLSVMELGVPIIIAFNFWEEAREKGIVIDYEGLEEELGVPVVRVNPLKLSGVRELVSKLNSPRRPRFKVKYDDHIEEAITVAGDCIPANSKLDRRGLAVRLIEGDPLVWELYGCMEAKRAREGLVRIGHDPYRDIEVTRSGMALELAKRYVKVVKRPKTPISKLDELFTEKPAVGALAGFLVITGLVILTVYIGGAFVSLLSELIGGAVSDAICDLESRGLLGMMLAKTVAGLYGQYVSALSYVFAFYLALIMLEEAGLLARIMVWMYLASKKLGLQPKAFIPALLGLGCSVPAITSTRILPTRRQRVAITAMLAFIPCSSRATVVFGIAGRTAGALAALFIYLQGFALALIAAWLVSRIIKAYEDAVMIEDIPLIRRPNLHVVLEKAWARLREFVLVVTPLVALGAIVYATLAYYRLDTALIGPLKPIAALLDLPPPLLIPLVYGFVQKDLVISMVMAVLGTTDPGAILSVKQAMVFTMASVYQVPCVIAFATMIRELGIKRALIMLISLDAMGLLISLLYARI